MAKIKTTIEIRHTKELTDTDIEFLFTELNNGNTSGYPGSNISYWNLNKEKVYSVEDIAIELIEQYNKDYFDIVSFDDKLDRLKSMLDDQYYFDVKHDNIKIDLDESFNCGDSDVDKTLGKDFHAITHEFNHIIEKMLNS